MEGPVIKAVSVMDKLHVSTQIAHLRNVLNTQEQKASMGFHTKLKRLLGTLFVGFVIKRSLKVLMIPRTMAYIK